MITLTGLQKVYHGESGTVIALEEVSLAIKQGEIYGIIGKSGAGKSTLIRCINLLERPTAGKVVVAGQDMTALSEAELREARKSIGMIFQHFNLLSSRTVLENVAFPLEIAGVKRAEWEKKVLPLLELVGLSDKKDVYPAQLSGGQKQRVGIARALASQPKVLLCDEATSALDPQTTESILTLLRDINKKLGLTIVLITHEMHVIKAICDQVAVIEGGQLVETGKVFDVFTKPKSATAREFIKAVVNNKLPEALAEVLSETPVAGGNLVVRLSFFGAATNEPVIAGLIRRFAIDVNIISGNIDHLQDTPYGTLLIELSGAQDDIQNALNYLQAIDLETEVIGYVARHAYAAG
ncbi:methionine ABC transporter ATP-binding protein [Sporomusa malonica]|uniref:D-methionine transport system ATP-binding protein n=1 Tax=Sporomusa malonica TaxID=112901 RepID=A0A1W2EYI9_9FIRM|nr:methionine ABC transporter ATP-binding protein [Sporomusa malonica]SMD14777.1 D-methionine transport system ATP-binding protein [Sporomusa malonica]